MRKQFYTILGLVMLLSSVSELSAQDGFSNFAVYNRVLLADYAENVDPETKQEIISLFKGLKDKVDGIEWIHVADLSKSTQGFDQAITITFASKEGLEAYEKHADHKRIMELAEGVLDNYASYEYWDVME